MTHRVRRHALCTCLVTLVLCGVRGELAAQSFPALRPNPLVVLSANGLARRDLYRETLRLTPDDARSVTDVELDGALDSTLALLHQVGVPLRPDRVLAGDDGIAFSAAFRLRGDLPSVTFHVGDRGPFDAFYANDGGFRWALTWPLRFLDRFALHLEGGEDSEFGTFAIADLQWRHPRRPLVIGIGIPMELAHAEGSLGVLCQLRMLLD
jgi:hypothetical protein